MLAVQNYFTQFQFSAAPFLCRSKQWFTAGAFNDDYGDVVMMMLMMTMCSTISVQEQWFTAGAFNDDYGDVDVVMMMLMMTMCSTISVQEQWFTAGAFNGSIMRPVNTFFAAAIKYKIHIQIQIQKQPQIQI